MNVALIFAGGFGSRMKSNGTPKQFLELNGAPIIIRTLEHFENHPQINAICVVCVEGWIGRLKKLLTRYEIEKVTDIVPGGKTGQESIRNGVQCILKRFGRENPVVLIHDGVRPLINEQVISDNIAGVREFGSAVTVAPAVETVVYVDGDKTLKTVLDRSRCFVARAPQSFYLRDVAKAQEQALADGIADEMVDTASLMHYYGHELHVVEGPMENIKVTTPTDFYTCRAYLQKREDSQIWGL